MLLRFTVENYRCFAKEASLSLVAGRDEKHLEHLLEVPGASYKALRGAAIYGANGHGKTKLVEAISFAKQLIINGTQSDEPINVGRFRLDESFMSKPAIFEFVIAINGIEYTYGFALDDEKIIEEWLYSRPKKQEVLIFERVTQRDGDSKIEIGSSFVKKGSKDRDFLGFVARGTRPNQLFLTEAIERNVKKIKPVYDWFRNSLTVVSAEEAVQPLEILASQEEEPFITFMGNFLRAAGTGIEAITTEEEPLDFEKHFTNIPESAKKSIEQGLAKGHVYTFTLKGDSFAVRQRREEKPVLIKLKTQHIGKNGRNVQFDFTEESSGTQRLMQILPILAEKSIRRNEVFVIDELDRKLHPLLSRMFVETFLSMKGESQLVFTTHETNLLDLDILRRDEIWFVEKDTKGMSHLYSMADFKVRPDLKIEKGYLYGRFGAIPYIGDVDQFH